MYYVVLEAELVAWANGIAIQYQFLQHKALLYHLWVNLYLRSLIIRKYGNTRNDIGENENVSRCPHILSITRWDKAGMSVDGCVQLLHLPIGENSPMNEMSTANLTRPSKKIAAPSLSSPE